MLNVTKRDKLFLNQFFAKNPDIVTEIVRFESSDVKDAFDSDFPAEECVFIRREYDGFETYLYIYRSSSKPKVIRKEVSNNEKTSQKK